MAKQSAIEQDGTVTEALSNAMFRVELAHFILPAFSNLNVGTSKA